MEHMATVKGAAPVVGFNHNVKYGPHVYHVQTEDSGLPHAHYITHLFVGGAKAAGFAAGGTGRGAGFAAGLAAAFAGAQGCVLT